MPAINISYLDISEFDKIYKGCGFTRMHGSQNYKHGEILHNPAPQQQAYAWLRDSNGHRRQAREENKRRPDLSFFAEPPDELVHSPATPKRAAKDTMPPPAHRQEICIG